MAERCLEGICGQYDGLKRHLRKLVTTGTKLDKDGNRTYANLRNPNTKPKTIPSLQDTRFKVTFRPNLLCRTGNGVRNLNVGDDEIVVCIYGLFNDGYDFKKGIDFVEGFPEFRYVFGKYSAFNPFTDGIFEEFERTKKESMEQLEAGQYKTYVTQALSTINRHLHVFKDFIADSKYVSKTL